MMQFDRIALGRMAKDMGFVRDILEKVCRLAEVLRYFESDKLLAESLALKGGTAINLTVFDLPRLSVDIDLDYCKSIVREDMISDREIINNKIRKYMKANGYHLSSKSKFFHALDSFVYEYVNAGGVKDNLKIEINYMLRCHVLPVEIHNIKLPWEEYKQSVLCVNTIEIFSSKTVALLSRAAARDLYDMYNMIRKHIFNQDDEEMLRKCIVFYSAIGAEQPPKEIHFNQIDTISSMQIKRDFKSGITKRGKIRTRRF